MLPMPLRFSVVIALVLALAAAITAMLNVLKFEQVLHGFEESRYGFVARDIQGALEQNLNLGLPLDQIDNAQELIERQLELDPDLTGIVIFDPAGTILYQASRLSDGAQTLLEARASGVTDEHFVSSPIANDFRQVVGGVIVRYSGTTGAQHQERVLSAMAVATISAAIAGGVVLWLGASWLLAPLRRRLAETTALLQQAREGSRQAQGASPFESLAGQALRDLRQVEHDVDRLQTSPGDRGDPP
jgi:hypothetical protein